MMNKPLLNHRFRGSALRKVRGQLGVSLIEVLIAIVVLSGGVLSLGYSHLIGLREQTNAHNRSAAAQLAEMLGDKIRANRDAVFTRQSGRQTGYLQAVIKADPQKKLKDITLPNPINFSSAMDQADFDIDQWNRSIVERFGPGGAVGIVKNVDGNALGRQIIIVWRSQLGAEVDPDGDPVISNPVDKYCPDNTGVGGSYSCVNYMVLL